jgi:hypothetical protein
MPKFTVMSKLKMLRMPRKLRKKSGIWMFNTGAKPRIICMVATTIFEMALICRSLIINGTFSQPLNSQ